MHDYGKFHQEPLVFEYPDAPSITVMGLYNDETDMEWHDVVAARPSAFYVAFDDNDVVVACQENFESIQLPGLRLRGLTLGELNGFTGGGPEGTIYGKVWQGNKIFDPTSTVEGARAAMPAITKRQLRLTLVRSGIALSTVTAAINAMPEGIAKDEALIEWDDASSFERLNPTLLMIGGVLGLDDDAIDQMWLAAMQA